MAEQLICNQQVVGSTPTTSSKRGKIPEWPKGADCKSVGTAFGGSNPPLPTKKKTSQCGVFFYAGKGVFCAVYPARRVAPEPPISVLDASLKNFIRLPFLLFHFYYKSIVFQSKNVI